MYYVITEKIRDGAYEYYGTCIVELEEGEEPSEHIFLQKIYEGVELDFDDYINGWQIWEDRYVNIYSWKKIESDADREILNKYGIH